MRFMRFTAALALLALIGTEVGAQEPKTITLSMKALNGSGEDGSAILTQTAEGVHVVIALNRAPDDAQPTHIHIGTCGAINRAPEYGLALTVNGKSDSIVKGIQLTDLMKAKYAINVHKSASDLGTYVSCGDIR
jgi:hypothetical protein